MAITLALPITLALALALSAPVVAWQGDGDCWESDDVAFCQDDDAAAPPPSTSPLSDDLGWRSSTDGGPCPFGEVCAEWIDQNGLPIGSSCCIPRWALGTRQISACSDPLVQADILR